MIGAAGGRRLRQLEVGSALLRGGRRMGGGERRGGKDVFSGVVKIYVKKSERLLTSTDSTTISPSIVDVGTTSSTKFKRKPAPHPITPP